MEFQDYYNALWVGRDASNNDIRRAYRRLARKYLPDVSKEADAESKFKAMKEACEVLIDPEKRSAYDQLGTNWNSGQESTPPQQRVNKFSYANGFAVTQGLAIFSSPFSAIRDNHRLGSVVVIRKTGGTVKITHRSEHILITNYF